MSAQRMRGQVTARSPWLAASVLLAIAGCSRGAWAQAAPDIPEHNRPNPAVIPERPPADDAAAKARILFDAILRGEPSLAADVFFPREAFLLVKDMRDPGRYYDRLRRRFDADIRALHAGMPASERSQAVFERFELATRGGYVKPREEGNRLPYWASRHSFIHYRVAGQPRRLEVRVLISWDARWYVIHLNEFK